ncbi:MAG: hypothetical protein ISP41_17675, partial [Alphaproteobacteria bacterium]|nr:hypothetical protein [Alphaproteobacteria bacterium]
CPTVAIFSTGSFPDKAAPRGDGVIVLSRDVLSDLSADEVDDALTKLARRSTD